MQQPRTFSPFSLRQCFATLAPTPLLLFASLTATVSLASAAELIPQNRVTNWTAGVTVGVPGGIPNTRLNTIDATQPPYNADKSGTTNSQPAIQAAINAAPENSVVYLPAGNYKLDSTIVIKGKNKITLRGAGEAVTKLFYHASNGAAVAIGSAADYQWNYPNLEIIESTRNLEISGNPTSGTSTLVVGDTRALNALPNGGVGQICNISLLNDPVLPVMNTMGFERSRRQMTRIIAKTSNTVTVFPAIAFDLPSKLAPRLNVAGSQSEFIGIEDLRIDGNNSTTGTALISLIQSYGCWVRNVSLAKTPNYFISISDSVQCEVRMADMRERKTVGTNGAGFLISSSTGLLIEDNIIYKIFPHLEINSGVTGSVFSYNFCEENNIYGIMGASIDSNHAPHNSYNLFEGNIASKFQSDGYFGGESEGTLFRNWFHGTSKTTDQFGICINLNRFSRNFNIVGNILGMTGLDPATGNPLRYLYDNDTGGIPYSNRYVYTFGLPNIGNGGGSGSAQHSRGSTWASNNLYGVLESRSSESNGVVRIVTGSVDSDIPVRALTWEEQGRFNATAGPVVNGSFQVGGGYGNHLPAVGSRLKLWVGPSGFQELDLDVRTTTLIKGNWNASSGKIHDQEKLAPGETLPPSMYRSVKPEFFGELAWPAFEPSNPNQSYDAIPAGYRYLHGKPAPGTGAPTAQSAPPSNVRINITTSGEE